MQETIEQLIKRHVDDYGTNHAVHRYCVMRKDLDSAIKILEREHSGIASVLDDITPVVDALIESVKYRQSS